MSGMSETQTSHEPGPEELSHVDAVGHAADGHAGDDDGAHGEEALGPVDVQAWGALLIGVGAGLVIAFVLLATTTLIR